MRFQLASPSKNHSRESLSTNYNTVMYSYMYSTYTSTVYTLYKCIYLIYFPPLFSEHTVHLNTVQYTQCRAYNNGTAAALSPVRVGCAPATRSSTHSSVSIRDQRSPQSTSTQTSTSSGASRIIHKKKDPSAAVLQAIVCYSCMCGAVILSARPLISASSHSVPTASIRHSA